MIRRFILLGWSSTSFVVGYVMALLCVSVGTLDVQGSIGVESYSTGVNPKTNGSRWRMGHRSTFFPGFFFLIFPVYRDFYIYLYFYIFIYIYGLGKTDLHVLCTMLFLCLSHSERGIGIA